jgi:hypothetical protein
MVSGREIEENLRRIFKRCVKCPPGAPACPPCAEGETCSLQAESCNSCATTTCVTVGSLPGQASTSSGTPIAPIVGGVVGGVAVIILITWLVWWRCIRKRRQAYDEQKWTDARVEKRDTTTLAVRAQSTRSVASTASTVLTRASNVIQIAYIPGVMNRSPPDSPALLAPPIPPIPSAMSSPRFAQDAHFFMPGDLRDSTYSDMTEEQRHSMAPSITPSLARASVATTIYRNNAVVSPQPAQRAFFRMGAPNVVSVKSGSTTPGSTSGQSMSTPPVPRVPKQHIGSSSIVGQNLKPRPIEVRKTSSKTSVPTLANLAKVGSTKEGPESFKSKPYSEEKEVLFTHSTSNLIDASATTTPALIPKPSFFSEASDRSSQISAILPAKGPLGHNHANTNSTGDSSALNAMIEDALNRAAAVHNPSSGRPSLHKHSSTESESGPFSDSNEMQENVDDMSR